MIFLNGAPFTPGNSYIGETFSDYEILSIISFVMGKSIKYISYRSHLQDNKQLHNDLTEKAILWDKIFPKLTTFSKQRK